MNIETATWRGILRNFHLLREAPASGNLQVCVSSGESTALFGQGDHSDQHGSYAEGTYHCKIGCIAKTMTATLMAHAAAEGHLRFEDECLALLGPHSLGTRAEVLLSAVRIQHLLNHTHGLDDSAQTELSRTARGFIDVAKLLDSGKPLSRISAPGDHFHNGRIGGWLCAAILERIYGATYQTLLRDRVLDVINHRECEAARHCEFPDRAAARSLVSGSSPGLADEHPCPASGGPLRLSALGLAQFARLHAEPEGEGKSGAAPVRLGPLRQVVFNDRSWHPVARKQCLGLKDFGDGWFGHNSSFDGDSIVLRFSPQTGISIVATSKAKRHALEAVMTILKDVSETAVPRQLPHLLTRDEWIGRNWSHYAGCFENEARTVTVEKSSDGLLKIDFEERRDLAPQSGQRSAKILLRPAAEEIFFCAPRNSSPVPFVQFLDPESGGSFRYLTLGGSLLRRVRQVV